ncbi:unnamed protein product [Penicillium olsonii]|uniref:Uncharacterized protein n=1 Tax=Penicillium olsonii TaxID=99116 RepID=A0A9W4HIH4_PENOL|nr:unnamed protein product [Penicillium olsonii]CAG8072236.1 unnamed protein product [Penicillium olsonii]
MRQRSPTFDAESHLAGFNGIPQVPSAAQPCKIEERAIDEVRPLKAIVIGSGISGILSCIRLRQRIPKLDLCIYEKNADLGGTWFENRYPGCACDIPSHTYQASFEPNKEWSSFYAKAPEIHAYWKRLARKYGCMDFIKFSRQVSEAVWDQENFKWQLKVENLQNSSTLTDSCDILIQATGTLNDWRWPSIPGLQNFKGKLMHSASWDESYEVKVSRSIFLQYFPLKKPQGKRVAVIGNGSSGIQIVPAILPDVPHIDHYIRSRTWISPPFAQGEMEKRKHGTDNFEFTAEEIKNFKTDHQSYQAFRKNVELELQSVHGVTLVGHPVQSQARDAFVDNMKRRLARKPGLIDHLIPAFPPACRRLTPGPGYLEALGDDKVDVVTSEIVKVNETGIITADGQHRAVDMLICATGFDTSFSPRFAVKGRGGKTLTERWKETPETYLSIATDEFPNYFISFGPNSGLGDGNLLALIEKSVDYFTACIQKMQRDNICAMSPRHEAVKRFRYYCDNYFQKTVFTSGCRSWYKNGTEDGRVTALWPGSSLHAMKALAHPRWEDFEYEYVSDNAVGWLGDGWTENEKRNIINVDYLDDDQVDFPPTCPSWSI